MSDWKKNVYYFGTVDYLAGKILYKYKSRAAVG
jgi:hypothetical protein